MIDHQNIELCNRVIRATFAQVISSQENLPFADKKQAQQSDIIGQQHLALVNTFGLLGYPMSDSLVALTELMNEDTGGDIGSESGITNYDILLDETNVDLYDRLLNISPPFQLDVSLAPGSTILNEVYESALRTSEFAGRLEANSIKLSEARNFLFPFDADGIVTKSKVYKSYEKYETSVISLEQRIETSHIDGDSNAVTSLKKKLSKVKAEWLSLGNKNKVEKAIEIIIQADASIGFEDERIRFINILEAKKRGLKDTSRYASVNISPLSALIDPARDELWKKVSLDASNIRKTLKTSARFLFDITTKEVDLALSLITSASFQYSTVLLGRKWLQDDFLQARYWKNPNLTISDGHGGGKAPTEATLAIFIRRAEFKIDNGIIASEGVTPPITPPLVQYKQGKTPLLKMLSLDLSKTINKQKLTTKIPVVQARQIKKIIKSQKLESKKIEHLPQSLKSTSFMKPRFTSMMAAQPIILAQPLVLAHPVFFHVPQKKISLRIQGIINLKGEIDSKDITLTVALFSSNNKQFNESTIILHEDGDKFKFNGLFKSHQNAPSNIIHSISLRLRRQNGGAILIEKQVFMKLQSRTVNITWTLTRSILPTLLSAEEFPTLMGYGLEVLPKSPNPDTSLDWDS